MDIPLQWTLAYLKETLPPDLLTYLDSARTALLHPSSPVHALRAALSRLAAEMVPLLASALDALAALLASSPTVVAAAVLLILAAVVLQILSIVRRILLFWTRLAFRLLFWAAVALLVSAVWQRGLERSARDAAAVGSTVAGWAAGAGEIWWREYEKAKQAQAQAQAYAHGQGQGRGYQYMAGAGAGAGAGRGAGTAWR
ncbi:hypothetical protein C7999DRAFT_29005 [Corynascus novoguineensis]|uniref:Nuclear pore assembly and biogenesis-domain-containing protein n=1 Tax=Corynascus novoguineensis TaxID=1126955 RepID=A0AAN7CYX0_9PEZI|nr:hypothetical protein C7999DRAFT_29005 [Corynascus novoguineensis]